LGIRIGTRIVERREDQQWRGLFFSQ
jgi:hypothetical protein